MSRMKSLRSGLAEVSMVTFWWSPGLDDRQHVVRYGSPESSAAPPRHGFRELDLLGQAPCSIRGADVCRSVAEPRYADVVELGHEAAAAHGHESDPGVTAQAMSPRTALRPRHAVVTGVCRVAFTAAVGPARSVRARGLLDDPEPGPLAGWSDDGVPVARIAGLVRCHFLRELGLPGVPDGDVGELHELVVVGHHDEPGLDIVETTALGWNR